MEYVWFVGQWKGDNLENLEIQGIFSTEEKARESCIKESYFYVRFVMDELLPDETMVNGLENYPCHYPLLEKSQNE